MMETKSVLNKVTQEVYTGLLPHNMVITDLGCSSGPNTLCFVSEVINIITKCQNKLGQSDLMDLQFFLNDLPGNDFNHLFQTLETFKKANETNHEGEIVPAYYICGVPGFYYTRLFPQQTIHLFHSSISLHWLSQVRNKTIYIYIVVQDVHTCGLCQVQDVHKPNHEHDTLSYPLRPKI